MASTHLFNKVVVNGFGYAKYGFNLASLVRNEKDKDEFKNNCEMFSKAAKGIDELLETTMEEREDWLEARSI